MLSETVTPTVGPAAVTAWVHDVTSATTGINQQANPVVMQLDGSGTVIERFLFDANCNALARSGLASTAWLLTDRLGSVRDVLDSSGNLQDTITYDAFGNITGETNSNWTGKIAFTGFVYSSATGLYFAQNRAYLASLGQWISQDPTGLDAGPNPSEYAGNDGTNAVDRSGLQDLPKKIQYIPNKVIVGAKNVEGQYLPNPGPSEPVSPGELLLTLSDASDGKMGKYRFKTVVDNPELPAKGSKGKHTVIFVAGNPQLKTASGNYNSERENWAVEAREEFGKKVYIYNDALSVKDIAERLKSFPPGSIGTLIIGGHSGPSGDGIFMGFNASTSSTYNPNDYKLVDGAENINTVTLGANAERLATIRQSLSPDAIVRLEACNLGDNPENGRKYAALFNSIVYVSQESVGGWGRPTSLIHG